MGLELEMRKLRELTQNCVLIEASRNPLEFLCTIGQVRTCLLEVQDGGCWLQMVKGAEMPDETDWDNYESGPFCRHWSDPSDCDAQCKCGHTCTQHELGEDTECIECECTKWREAQEEAESDKIR